MTIIEKEFECDTYFPIENFEQYQLEEYSHRMVSYEEQCYFRHLIYKKRYIYRWGTWWTMLLELDARYNTGGRIPNTLSCLNF